MSNLDQQNEPVKTENADATSTTQEAPVKDKVEELTDLLQRTQANFENYRKQVTQRITDAEQMALKKFLIELLPVLDTFHLALKNPTQKVEDVREGMELLYAQLLSALEKSGVVALDSLGAKFDPLYHQPLMKVPCDEPVDTIVEEFQKGYLLHGKVLRAARVKVSDGPGKSHPEKDLSKTKSK
ncbi:nucleotide exchange factor GrpE [Candidatus Woesearchaeota archaeon]|nr:nucleotide exchange factor GrpE [Candidatus Woesearchaeota archaeon]